MSTPDLFGKTFKITFWSVVIIECLSLLAHLYSFLNPIFFFIIIPVVFCLSLWKIKYGFWIAATELFIGSFGYLFFYDVGSFRVSVRLGIFLAVWLAWLVQAIRKKRFEFWPSPYRWPLVLFLATVCLGVIIAMILGNSPKNIFFDVNAYLYFGLFLVALSVLNSWDRMITLGQLLMASVLATAFKTVAMLFFFSHATDPWIIRTMYTWIRDTRIGEIAPITGMYYRIFFQSHIWSFFVLIGLMLCLLYYKKSELPPRQYRWFWIMTILSSLTLIISFSRSFWLALAVVIIVLVFFLKAKARFSMRRMAGFGIGIVLIAIVDVALITGFVNVKLPGGSGNGLSAVALISERLTTTDEAAIGSRYQLLKPLVHSFLKKPLFGSGFGTTVSYQTLDPRTKTANGGWYTTYAFEWGWLDILVKIGIVGLAAYLYLIWKIFSAGIHRLREPMGKPQHVLIISLLFCIIGLVTVHVTTPFLNHPLGIFLLIGSAAFFLVKPQPS